MAQYLITYLGGNPPASPEEGKKNFDEYKTWLKALGDIVISPANPLKNTHTVKADGSKTQGGETAMSGFTIIEAASMSAALDHARRCPFLKTGGTLEVSELVQLRAL